MTIIRFIHLKTEIKGKNIREEETNKLKRGEISKHINRNIPKERSGSVGVKEFCPEESGIRTTSGNIVYQYIMNMKSKRQNKTKNIQTNKNRSERTSGGVDPINAFNAVNNSMSYVPRHETI